MRIGPQDPIARLVANDPPPVIDPPPTETLIAIVETATLLMQGNPEMNSAVALELAEMIVAGRLA